MLAIYRSNNNGMTTKHAKVNVGWRACRGEVMCKLLSGWEGSKESVKQFELTL
jgi:hypothetical protein